MNGSGRSSLCGGRPWGQSQTLLNLKYKLPPLPTEDDYYQTLCHGRGGSTGGIQGSQKKKKKPELQSLNEFSDSKIFRLDFSVKAVEITRNASLPHTVGIPGTLGSRRTTQGPQPHSLVTYLPRHDEYVTRDIGPWV